MLPMIVIFIEIWCWLILILICFVLWRIIYFDHLYMIYFYPTKMEVQFVHRGSQFLNEKNYNLNMFLIYVNIQFFLLDQVYCSVQTLTTFQAIPFWRGIYVSVVFSANLLACCTKQSLLQRIHIHEKPFYF